MDIVFLCEQECKTTKNKKARQFNSRNVMMDIIFLREQEWKWTLVTLWYSS